MANNYQEWASLFKIDGKHIEWIRSALSEAIDIPDSFLENGEDPARSLWNKEPGSWLAPWRGNDCEEDGDIYFHAELDNGKLYVNSEGDGDLERLSIFLTHLSERTGDPYTVEYCFYCSKPRPDEFGGGVFVAYKGNVAWSSTNQMGKELLEEMKVEEMKKEGVQ